MNFTELMNIAAQNKDHAAKQHTRKLHGPGGKSDPRVSSAAVQAFLNRREREKKQQQAEQEEVHRARIQARLEQSLESKKKARKKSAGETTADNSNAEKDRKRLSNSTETFMSSKHSEKTKIRTAVVDKRPSNETDNHSNKLHKKEADKRVEQQGHRRKGAVNATRQPDRSNIVKQQTMGVAKRPDVLKQASSATAKGKKNASKKGAPVDIKELLAIAELNKNRPPGAIGGLVDKRIARNGERSASGLDQTRPAKAPAKEKKTSLTEYRNGKLERRGVDAVTKTPKKKDVGKAAANEKLRERKKDEKNKSKMASHKVSENSGRELQKALSNNRHKVAGSSGFPPVSAQDRHLNRKRYRPVERTFSDDEMNDFIDDEETNVDVSKYIREIFGYDRSRYQDADDDCAFMESSFSQIEKEETRSAKIAKLEDEIDILKEQAELKRQKKALMKERKKK